MTLLDEIAKDLSELTDEQIAEAAQKILARQAKTKAAMTPDRIQKGKDREKRRRALNSAILKAAKEKGLVAAAAVPVEGEPAQA